VCGRAPEAAEALQSIDDEVVATCAAVRHASNGISVSTSNRESSCGPLVVSK
jgi:hypothetical protein